MLQILMHISNYFCVQNCCRLNMEICLNFHAFCEPQQMCLFNSTDRKIIENRTELEKIDGS